MKSFSVFFLLAWPLLALAQYPNIRVSSRASTRPEEVTIAINPANPQNLAAGANIDFYYFSVDGGTTWTEGHLSSSLRVAGDPCVTFDANGHLYYAHLSNPPGGYWLDRIVVQKSTDGGITWNDGSTVGLNPPKQQDKEWLAVDITDSPYHNFLYIAWTEFDKYGSANPADSSRILFARSTDFAETWSQPVRVSDRGGDALDSDGTMEGAVPAIGPHGEIYLSWSGPDGIYFDKSLDGGQTFGKDQVVIDQPGGWDFEVPGISRCNGMPITGCDISPSPYRGNIYIVWSDQRNGSDNTDVFLIRSTDGGKTWSDLRRVNTDTTSRHQFFPWMAVDPVTGIIYVVFYDRRNTQGTATEVYLAKSKDGGISFENFKISDSSFTPRSKIFIGDYINIAAYDRRVYPIWTRLDGDFLSVWTAQIRDVSTSVMDDEQEFPRPEDFQLLQNYPNPFNGETLIRYRVRKSSALRLRIFNAYGQEIRTLVEAKQPAGVYTVMWDGRDNSGRPMSSGIYLVKFEHGGRVQSKKLVLIR